MSQPPISERQQYWLEHVCAAVNSDHSQAEYARTHGLKVRDLYQWKTLLTRRGFSFDQQKAVQATPTENSVGTSANDRKRGGSVNTGIDKHRQNFGASFGIVVSLQFMIVDSLFGI